MTKLAIFQRQASVDTNVTLRLTRGDDISGRIAEIDDTHVCLDLGGGKIVTVFEDILAGWDVHRENRVDTRIEDSRGYVPPAKPSDKTPANDGLARSGVVSDNRDDAHEEPSGAAERFAAPNTVNSPGSRPETDPPARQSGVRSALAKIEATFSEATRRARLDPPEPNFEFSTADFPAWHVEEIRRDWDRARNQYNYALKVKELGRLNNIIVQILEPLARRYPDSATARSLLGRMMLMLDRGPDAKDHLSAAAVLSEVSGHWLALAWVADDDTATECYALRRYFYLTSPSRSTEAWYRYLAVSITHDDYKEVFRIIHHWSETQEADPDLGRLLVESLIYLLSSSRFSSLAEDVTASLLHTSGKLPAGWQDELTHEIHPSERLLVVEREFSRPSIRTALPDEPLPSQDDDRVRHGRVVSFGNQRFGFIDAGERGTFFFRIGDIKDDNLHRALLDGSWRTFGEIEFQPVPSQGHKYNRATDIVRLQDSESLLQRAQTVLKIGQHSQAMAFVRRVLKGAPTDQAALRLEEQIKKDIRKQLQERGIGLPKGRGPYARAKRAQFVAHNLEEAEDLFRQAIRRGDKTESAVKDLASLLQQQGRAEESIVLLEEESRDYKGVSPFDNMLATAYQHIDRHDDAIKILTRLKNTSRPSQRTSFLKRMANSHFKCARYADAEKVLQELIKSDPDDRLAVRWLAELQDARSAESDTAAEEIMSGIGRLAEEGVELRPLARAAIDYCTYEGVDPARIQAGTVTESDIAYVEELAKKLGTKRPRDHAAYYLSAAALLDRLDRDSGDGDRGRIYDYLRRYFASMADASWIEMKPADVVRSYYIESVALVLDDTLDEAWRSLMRYLATFLPEKSEIERIFPRGVRPKREKYIGALRQALEMVAPKAGPDWTEGVLSAGAQSGFAKDALGDAILASPILRDTFGDLSGNDSRRAGDAHEIWQTGCREHLRVIGRRLSRCRALTKYQATVASMEDLVAEIRSISEETSSELERRRLNVLLDIVSAGLDFCRASDFEEKERNYWLVTTQADRFRKEVVDSPTRYSYEGLLPVAEHINSLVEEEYAEMARTSGAELSLRLLVEEYLRGRKGELKLQIEIANKRGCSPASSVRICLGPADSPYFDADHWEREVVPTLRGGDTEVTQMVIHPKDSALRDRAFPISAMAIYENRLGEEIRTEEHVWTVRLYPDDQFRSIENPYAPFAEGGPVDNAEMFVGREELLARLESSLLYGSGSKSIVMFGQKRAGKSSLIEHLRRRLVRNSGVVPVRFSLQDIASELSVAALLHRILQGLAEALEDLRFDGRDLPDFAPPAIDVLESHPTLRFHDLMSSLIRSLRYRESGLNVVLLVDEFTDIFKEIRRGHIPRQFMKAWKAIIEKKYFASVLVGQDIMPDFKAEFPNEFGVTEDIRVTYLDHAAAEILIRKPIGKERFAGRAVGRLLDLTAGSPYYTMMFCARLVDYMNATRSMIVTEADILSVEDEMLRGDRRLTKDKFDNLLSAGDGAVDSGIEPDDTYAVCREIAQRSGKEGWCARELIQDFDATALDTLLLDLETRDVVERKGTAYQLRVGLFRDWLALQA